MPHDAVIIANKLIQLAIEKEKLLTPIQIIKLVYICHGFMLGLYKRPLINQEIEAWQYGPVISTLYNKLRKYKGSHVTREIKIWPPKKGKLDNQENDIIKQVFSKYAHLSGPVLSTLTHLSGTPWQIVRSQIGKNKKGIIPNDLIQEYYSQLCRNDKS